MRDTESPLEMVAWRAKVTMPSTVADRGTPGANGPRPTGGIARDRDAGSPARLVRFPGLGVMETPVSAGSSLTTSQTVAGPAIITLPASTLVLPPRSLAVAHSTGIIVDVMEEVA
jgi:hypothetical protein